MVDFGPFIRCRIKSTIALKELMLSSNLYMYSLTENSSELFWSPDVQRPSVRPSVCLSVCLSVNFSHFHLLLQNHWANFNQTWHKASLGVGDSSFQVCTNEGPHIIPRGDNYEIVKIHWEDRFKNFLFNSHWSNLNSNKLGTKHPWVHVMQGDMITKQ